MGEYGHDGRAFLDRSFGHEQNPRFEYNDVDTKTCRNTGIHVGSMLLTRRTAQDPSVLGDVRKIRTCAEPSGS